MSNEDGRDGESITAADVVETLGVGVDFVTAPLGPAGKLIGAPVKALIGVAAGPLPADARMRRADAEAEVAAEVERSTDAKIESVRALASRALDAAIRVAAVQRADPYRETIAELIAKEQLHVNARLLYEAGVLDDAEVAESRPLAEALYRTYRDAVDAVDPRTVPAFVRLATIYQATPMNRAARALGDFLRAIEPDEWPVALHVAENLEAFVPFLEETPQPHALNVTMIANGVAIRLTRLHGSPRVVEVEDRPGGPIVAAVLRLLVRADVAVSNVGGVAWRDATQFGIRAEMVRALTYALRGGSAVPPPPA